MNVPMMSSADARWRPPPDGVFEIAVDDAMGVAVADGLTDRLEHRHQHRDDC